MSPESRSRFAPYAWFTLAYTTFVILWGAMVRITGSGAGCGQHWPTCNGQIVPTAPELETIIEFGHRLTSGLTVPMIVALVVIARRALPPGAWGRKAAWLSLGFILIECLIGAALVLLEYVALDDSPWRAVWMAGHLANTFLLTGWMLGVAWAAGGRPAPRWPRLGGAKWPLFAMAMGILVVTMTGGVTALGDTLYPVDVASTSILERIRGEQNGVTNFLMQLRIVHPALACLVGLALIVVPLTLEPPRYDVRVKRAAAVVAAASATQVLFGGLNIYLSAPAWMQIGHLLLALLLWLVFLWYVFVAASPAPTEA